MTDATPSIISAPVAQAPAPGAQPVGSSGAPAASGTSAEEADSAGDFAALLAGPAELAREDPAAPPTASTTDPGQIAPVAAAPQPGNALPFAGVALPLDVIAGAGRPPRAETPGGVARAAAATMPATAAPPAATIAAAAEGEESAGGALAALSGDAGTLPESAAGFADAAATALAAGKADEGGARTTLAAPVASGASLPSGLAPGVAGYGDVAARGPGEVIPHLHVPVPVTDPDFGDALGAKVLWQVGSQVQSAQLILNPPALGPVEVRVEMHDDTAQLYFVAQHGTTREAIEEAMPRLREILAQAGVQLGDTSVSAQASGGQRSFQSGPDGEAFPGRSRLAPADAGDSPVARPRLRLGLVDAYV